MDEAELKGCEKTAAALIYAGMPGPAKKMQDLISEVRSLRAENEMLWRSLDERSNAASRSECRGHGSWDPNY